MAGGAFTLGDYPLPVVRLECPRCGRKGQYRRDGLVTRFGPDAALPDVLVALADCDRRADYSQPCGVRYPDLTNSDRPS